MTSRRSSEAGFSLVEVLVASFLMAIIVAALGAVTAQWMPNWNRGFAAVQRTDLLTSGLERLVEDLGAALPVSTGEGKALPLFDGGELAVTFVRTALGPNAGRGLEVVRIGEVGADKGPMLVRSTQPFLPYSPDVAAAERPFGNAVTVVRPPYRVSFAYAGPDGNWESTWQNANALPTAIRINVRVGSSSRAVVSTIAGIQAGTPAACANAKAPTDCPAVAAAAAAGTPAPSAAPPQPGGGPGQPVPVPGGRPK